MFTSTALTLTALLASPSPAPPQDEFAVAELHKRSPSSGTDLFVTVRRDASVKAVRIDGDAVAEQIGTIEEQELEGVRDAVAAALAQPGHAHGGACTTRGDFYTLRGVVNRAYAELQSCEPDEELLDTFDWLEELGESVLAGERSTMQKLLEAKLCVSPSLSRECSGWTALLSGNAFYWNIDASGRRQKSDIVPLTAQSQAYLRDFILQVLDDPDGLDDPDADDVIDGVIDSLGGAGDASAPAAPDGDQTADTPTSEFPELTIRVSDGERAGAFSMRIGGCDDPRHHPQLVRLVMGILCDA